MKSIFAPIIFTRCHLTSQPSCFTGKMRMRLPVRSSQCDHLQCFDAANYIMMNEKKDKWMCPVCNNIAPFDTLMLDGYFSEILESRRLPTGLTTNRNFIVPSSSSLLLEEK